MADDNFESKYKIIANKSESRIKDLRKEITNIEFRQQDIQKYISTMDTAINSLESLITQEDKKQQPDYNKITKYRQAISKNIELVSDLLNVNRGYEETKFRYNKEIDDVTMNYTKFLNHDLRKLDKNLDDLENNSFFEMMKQFVKMFSSNEIPDQQKQEKRDEVLSNATKELEENDDYEL